MIGPNILNSVLYGIDRNLKKRGEQECPLFFLLKKENPNE